MITLILCSLRYFPLRSCCIRTCALRSCSLRRYSVLYVVAHYVDISFRIRTFQGTYTSYNVRIRTCPLRSTKPLLMSFTFLFCDIISNATPSSGTSNRRVFIFNTIFESHKTIAFLDNYRQI